MFTPFEKIVIMKFIDNCEAVKDWKRCNLEVTNNLMDGKLVNIISRSFSKHGIFVKYINKILGSLLNAVMTGPGLGVN